MHRQKHNKKINRQKLLTKKLGWQKTNRKTKSAKKHLEKQNKKMPKMTCKNKNGFKKQNKKN